MAPPPCSLCGSLDNAFLSYDLRCKWVSEENLKWRWYKGLAYWRLCQLCHREVWPADQRNRNGSSLPWSALLFSTKRAEGKASLVVGDFFLTRAPPELLRAGSLSWWGERPQPLDLDVAPEAVSANLGWTPASTSPGTLA